MPLTPSQRRRKAALKAANKRPRKVSDMAKVKRNQRTEVPSRLSVKNDLR